MEKLDLHESVRIYIPGLFICLLGGYFVFGAALDFSKLAVIAIFIGLVYAPAIYPLHDKYFRRIVARYGDGIGFKEVWKREMVKQKSGQLYGNVDRKINLLPVESVSIYLTAYYASRYNSAELYGFRLQKTFGVMYFNIAVASLVGVGVIVIEWAFDILPKYSPLLVRARYDLAALVTIAGLSYWAAKNHFKRSLDNELLYWRGMSAAEMLKFSELLCDEPLPDAPPASSPDAQEKAKRREAPEAASA